MLFELSRFTASRSMPARREDLLSAGLRRGVKVGLARPRASTNTSITLLVATAQSVHDRRKRRSPLEGSASSLRRKKRGSPIPTLDDELQLWVLVV
jgi:hypothetical protein